MSTHCKFALLFVTGIYCLRASGDEVLRIPHTPTVREHLTQEQIRRDWEKLILKARNDAVTILRKMQCPDGGWESLPDPWGGEASVLAVEALIDNGVAPDEPAMIKGLRNVRLR